MKLGLSRVHSQLSKQYDFILKVNIEHLLIWEKENKRACDQNLIQADDDTYIHIKSNLIELKLNPG